MNKRERSKIKCIITILEHEMKVSNAKFKFNAYNGAHNKESYHLGKIEAFAKSSNEISKLLK